MSNLGSCWSCISDVDMPSTMATGFACLGQAIARRWQTPRGGLIDDPNYGFDLTDYIGGDLGKNDLARLAHMAGEEATKDERVKSCAVTVTLLANGDMLVVGQVTTADGPFSLVVSVSGVSVTLLQASGTNQ